MVQSGSSVMALAPHLSALPAYLQQQPQPSWPHPGSASTATPLSAAQRAPAQQLYQSSVSAWPG